MGINPFLTWLPEIEYTKEHLKIKRVKFQKRVMRAFSDAQIKAILNYKPKNLQPKSPDVLFPIFVLHSEYANVVPPQISS
jgi:hypothetical protein